MLGRFVIDGSDTITDGALAGFTAPCCHLTTRRLEATRDATDAGSRSWRILDMPLDIATVAFWVIAIVLVGSSLAVVLLRNIVHAALFLALVFGAAAGVYVLLNAEFIAIVQVLIYAGAVTILVLFAIMLTQNAMSRGSSPFGGQTWLAAVIALALCAGLIFAVGVGPMAVASPSASVALASSGAGSVARIGQLLYSPFSYSYVLPFEIASVVLLAAIIGAIIIGRED
jgi:NADH:ubiquinone oxidoreductase subunit 6 (subunit J)